MAVIGRKIVSVAIDILARNPEGVRYSDLVRLVLAADPTLKKNTVNGNVWDLDQKYPDVIYKPSRGLFRLTEYRDALALPGETLAPTVATRVQEEDFYTPFALWLVNDLQECTKAIPLGGSIFKDKWGTPDVIGKWESQRSDIVQAPLEIVSAEIKTDSNQLITAFGQACAYRLFSHRSHLVVPQQSSPDEIGRLDSLCGMFGIGLVLFDCGNPEDPRFTIRVRAARQEPDMFYLNRALKKVEKELFS